ncbi:MAG TPA: DUF1571 domain-containing protein [Gemmataceae bacterium]|jgi:hypothetical protein|nr:DUF1571 domain-containing protein [Gemmataceae bacterium]
MRREALASILYLIALSTAAGCFALRPRHPANQEMARGQMQPPAPDPLPKIEPPPPPTPKETPAQPVVRSEDSQLRRLANKALEKEKTLNSYICRLRRRERPSGKSEPMEVIMVKYRRSPFSIHFKWLGEENKGREIIYVKGQHDDKIQLLTGQGDWIGPGHYLEFASDSELLKSRSRYPIQEGGIGAAVLRFGALLDAVERGQPNAGSLRYLGRKTRAEFPTPLETVEQAVVPGVESLLPKGGTRYIYFEETSNLPLLIQTYDHNQNEVEYYCFDRLQTPVPLDDADFDPVKLWPGAKK